MKGGLHRFRLSKLQPIHFNYNDGRGGWKIKYYIVLTRYKACTVCSYVCWRWLIELKLVKLVDENAVATVKWPLLSLYSSASRYIFNLPVCKVEAKFSSFCYLWEGQVVVGLQSVLTIWPKVFAKGCRLIPLCFFVPALFGTYNSKFVNTWMIIWYLPTSSWWWFDQPSIP